MARYGNRKKCPLMGGRALQVRGEWEQIGMETRLTVTFPPYLYRDYYGRLRDQIYGTVSAFTVQEVRTKRKGKKMSKSEEKNNNKSR